MEFGRRTAELGGVLASTCRGTALVGVAEGTMRSLQGRVVAITGAGSGIGRGLAQVCAARGGRLALADRDAEGLQATADALGGVAGGAPIATTLLDVADRDALYAWADATAKRFGEVHVIINNAGVALGSTVEGASEGDLHWIMDINLFGVIHGTRAFLPHLRAAGFGHIVNISSIFGIIPVPTQSYYCASKAAVRAFTEVLRQELELEGSPVSATVVHPGGVRTEIARRSRLSEVGMQAVMGRDGEAGQTEFDRYLRLDPRAAAEQIVRAIERDQRRVLVGADAKALSALHRLSPVGLHGAVVGVVRRQRRKLAAKG